jgi:hypothetical protein
MAGYATLRLMGSKHSGTAKTNPSLFQGIAFRDVTLLQSVEISHGLKVPFHLSVLRLRLETNGLFEFTSLSRMQVHVDLNIRSLAPIKKNSSESSF